jgi:hypothetical protein
VNPTNQFAATSSTGRSSIAVLLCCFLLPAVAIAQQQETSKQVWGNFILSLPQSEKLYLEYDIEGATQVSGGDDWNSLYGTGVVEYYPNAFLDLTGEAVTGYTNQTSGENSFEATARLGFRLHLIRQIFNSSFVKKIRSERMSGQRFSIANFARMEYRNFWYSSDRPSEDELRFRNRVETKFALNSPSLSADGTWYFIGDVEWFVPIGDQVAERFATKRRIRAGFGYRRNYVWRFELLAIGDNTRDTLEDSGEAESRMLDLRVKRFF